MVVLPDDWLIPKTKCQILTQAGEKIKHDNFVRLSVTFPKNYLFLYWFISHFHTMYFLSQEFHSVKEENENLRKENRSNVPLYTYIIQLFWCFRTRAVESESREVGKSLKIGKIGKNRKNRIWFPIWLFGKNAKMP